MKYVEVLMIEEDDDFEQLSHLGKSVEYVIVPRDRRSEYLNSSGHVALLPIGNKGLLYYFQGNEKAVDESSGPNSSEGEIEAHRKEEHN